MAAKVIPNSDITVYNKYIDPTTRGELYKRSEVYNVVWQASKAITTMRNPLAANSATVFIPFGGNTEYLTPKAWQALTDKDNNWTLQEGDVIVRTIVDEEITGDFTMSDLRATYDDVFAIASVDAMDQGSEYMRHWQVGLK